MKMNFADGPTLTNFLLTSLAVLGTFTGVIFAIFAWFQWREVTALKKQLLEVEKRVNATLYKATAAAHRIIASYTAKDLDAKIALLQEAIRLYPDAFNAWNALGYAWIEKGSPRKALEAFEKAIELHPYDKAGYFDMAYALLELDEPARASQIIQKAFSLDAASRQEFFSDPRFQKIHDAFKM